MAEATSIGAEGPPPGPGQPGTGPVTGDSSRTVWLQQARSRLRQADPVLARLIDERPDFDPRAWLIELPPMNLYGALLFQVTGQQLSVAATRRTLARIADLFGGHRGTHHDSGDRTVDRAGRPPHRPRPGRHGRQMAAVPQPGHQLPVLRRLRAGRGTPSRLGGPVAPMTITRAETVSLDGTLRLTLRLARTTRKGALGRE